MDQFRKEVTNLFNYQEINNPHSPMAVGIINLEQFKPYAMGYISYFFSNLSDPRFLQLPDTMRHFIHQCVAVLEANQIPYDGRRFHISLDNSSVIKGQSHREKRWHIDVPHCEKPAIIFLASDCLPTEFITNPPKLNWPEQEFNSVEEDVIIRKNLDLLSESEERISAKPNELYLMNSYQIHRGVISNENISKRTFLRLIIETPIRKKYPRFSQREYQVAEKEST